MVNISHSNLVYTFQQDYNILKKSLIRQQRNYCAIHIKALDYKICPQKMDGDFMSAINVHLLLTT